ncbi:MAG: SET domain-containing protein [Planctomycetales bacterium]|nr:SET domain-containing protein [Planctomycetales bacterium]
MESDRTKRRSVRIGQTKVGKGVFARRAYPKSAVVGEIAGDVIDDPDYTSDYCIELNDRLSLEPYAPFRFLNHCCDPNCEFDFDEVELGPDGEYVIPTVYLFAMHDIEAGEELTIDYNWPASNAIPCECGSLACRGWVVAEDEKFA